MTRIEIENSLRELNKSIMTGNMMDGFEKFYHENVTMQENELPPTVGKEANRKRELQFLADVTAFRKAEMKGMGIGDDISFVAWEFDYTHKDWGVRNYPQVSVQHWKDGKIIHEQFIYTR
ncbi:MAG: hypothetical protein J0L56_14745 [Chitinophagales bacterium]|nr:hypothetical protein [Chitinophagales bacterium]